MAKVKSVHVVWLKKGARWKIKAGGKYATVGGEDHWLMKREAIRVARELSRELKAELKVHNMDGRISISDSHGNDPRGIRG